MTQAEARNIIKTCIAPNAVGLYNAGDIIMVQHVMAHFDRNPYEVLNEMSTCGYLEYRVATELSVAGRRLTELGAQIANM